MPKKNPPKSNQSREIPGSGEPHTFSPGDHSNLNNGEENPGEEPNEEPNEEPIEEPNEEPNEEPDTLVIPVPLHVADLWWQAHNIIERTQGRRMTPTETFDYVLQMYLKKHRKLHKNTGRHPSQKR